MSFPTVLNSTQLEKLRGTSSVRPSWRGTVHMSLCPNAIVWKTRVSVTPVAKTFAFIQYGSTLSGSSANVIGGMTLYSGAVDDIRQATFRGRVRSAPATGIMGINETNHPFQVNDYLWVINDYALWEKLARDDGTAYYKDWEIAFRQLPPVITGVQSAYAGFVSGSPAGLTIAFSASAYAATAGASISSWAWSVPSGATLTAGSATSATPTYRFDAGFANWISVTATDSGGRTATRRVFVAAHDRGSNKPRSGFSSVSVNADLENGYSASLTAFDPADFDDVLDNTLVVLWVDEIFNGTAGSLLGAPQNIAFVGRLRRETIKIGLDERAGVVSDSQFELEGFGTQLARLHAPKIALRDKSSPAIWDEINTLTPWRCVVHVLAEHSTALSLCDLSFDSTANTFRLQQLATQDGNLLACVNDILDSINAGIEFSASGAMRGIRDPRYLSTSERNALSTVINFTDADVVDVSIGREHIFTIGRCEASGGSYNSSANQVTPFLSLAPGNAQNSGEGSTTLARQVLSANVADLTAQAELNVRSGHHLAASNRGWTINATHLDGYAFLTPSRYTWYTFAISENVRGVALTSAMRWLCQSVSTSYDENGTRSVSAAYAAETAGTPGNTVRYPAPGAIPINFTEYPPIDSYPGIGIIEPIDEYLGGEKTPIDSAPTRLPLKRDGNTVAVWSANELYYTVNFLTGGSNPEWLNISPDVPTGGTIRAFVWDTFSEAGAYCMVDNATNTALYYTADVRDLDWQLKNTFEGIYDVLRLTDTAGSVAIYTARNLSATTVTQTLVATFDAGGAAYNIISGSSFGGGNPGNCWGDELAAAPPLTSGTAIAEIDIPLPAGASGVSMSFNFKHGTDDGGANMVIGCYLKDSVGNQILGPGPSGMLGPRATDNTTANIWRSESVTFTPGSKPGAAFAYFSVLWGRNNGEQRKVYMDNCSVTFEASIGAGARAVFLSNYGTSATYVSVGTAISDAIGGFAVQPIGTHTYAAIAAQVRESTTLGGAYSNDGAALTSTAPRLLVIPTHVFTSNATKNTGANPHYLVGSGALVSGEALWRDEGSRTAITPVISGNSGLSVSPNCAAMWRGARLAALLSFGGTRRLVTTTNTGGAWSDRGAQNAAANHIRILPASKAGNELFWANGDHVRYSPDFGVTVRAKTTPFGSGLIGVEPR